MGIFQKLSTLIRSNINDLISRAENPEKMLNQIILDLRQIRQEHGRLGEQMGRLEKRLRKTLSKEEGRT